MVCQRNHDITDKIVRNLPINQGGFGRHQCAACAYEAGLNHAQNSIVDINLKNIIEQLNESQKGDHRHIDPVAAYVLGYYNGLTGNY